MDMGRRRKKVENMGVGEEMVEMVRNVVKIERRMNGIYSGVRVKSDKL